MFTIGLIPLVAMFCRVIASCYQIFTFNKYRDGCLRYEIDNTRQQLMVKQVQFTEKRHLFHLKFFMSPII